MNDYKTKVEHARSLLGIRQRAPKEPRILLGHRDGKPFYLEGKELDNSIHIMGATREGKSKQLQNLFRQFLLQGIGCCFIDPHGTLYGDLVADCSYYSARHPELRDKIVLVDPGDDENIVGFNSLQQIGDLDEEMLILSRMYAMIKARGKNNFDDFPTAKVWLQNIFTPLFKKGLTLIEAKHLIDRAGNAEIARNIVSDTGVDLVESDWKWIRSVSKKIQYEELLSSVNMLRSFVTTKRMELIFGRKQNVLDLRSIMDEGKIVLVNLGFERLHDDISVLFGTQLVNEIFLAARTRPDGARPFYVAIDEFENYVTEDIGKILDQAHKFGLRLVLAHHSLEQVKQASEKVYAAVMQNAKTKIIFGGLTYDNAEVMAKEMFTYAGNDGLDPFKVKRVQKSPYIEPIESTRTIRSKGQVFAAGDMSGEAEGMVIQSGETRIPVPGWLLSEQVVQAMSSQALQRSKSAGQSNMYSEMYSEAIIPFVEQYLKWFVSGVDFMSLEEQLFQAIAKMKNLPQQVCMVKLAKSPVVAVKANFVEEHHRLHNEVKNFTALLNSKSPYHLPALQAKEEREKITADLAHLCSSPVCAIEDDEDRFE